MRHHLLSTTLALIIATAPSFVLAQQGDAGSQGADQRTDRNDDSEWGWLGLLGLIGLAGLKRRERHDDVSMGKPLPGSSAR